MTPEPDILERTPPQKYRIIIEERRPGYRVVLLRFNSLIKKWEESHSESFLKDRDHAKVIKVAQQWKQAYRIKETERIQIEK